MTAVALADTCLSAPGCTRPRLPYAGGCSDHCGPYQATPATRCVAPIRCYCPDHLGATGRHNLGPHHSPESIRLMLAAKATAKAPEDAPLRLVPA